MVFRIAPMSAFHCQFRIVPFPRVSSLFLGVAAFGFLALSNRASAALLEASDGVVNDLFGNSVSQSGSSGLVGAGSLYGVKQGWAYLFRNLDTATGTVTQTAKLVASDAALGDYFGNSVSQSGNSGLVGAYYADITYTNQGAAYLYRNLDTATGTVTQTAKLIASDAATDVAFGYCVSQSGNSGLVSAHGATIGANRQGAAYLFRNLDTATGTVTQAAKLIASDGVTNDAFSVSVSLSGNSGLAGAYGKNSYQGAAYLYRNLDTATGTVTQNAKLTASDGAANDYLGAAVSQYGSNGLVGAYGKNSSQGSVYLFRNLDTASGNVTETAKLTATDGAANDYLGFSVSQSGNNGLAGAYGKNSSQGAAYLYRNLDTAAGTVTETVKITASAGAGNDQFGFSVGLDGDQFIIGAQKGNGMAADSGTAYSGSVASITTLDAGSTAKTISGISFISQVDWIIGQTTSSNQVTLSAGDTANVTASGKGVYIGKNAASNNNLLVVAGNLTATQITVGATGNSGNTLQLGGSNKISDSATVTLAGGILDTTASGYIDTVGTFNMSAGSLNGTGTITATTYGLTGGTVTANLGTGTMNVTGSTALNGTAGAAAVNISAGTLTFGSSNRLADAATVTVSGTGILNTSTGLTDTVGTFNMSAGSLNGTGTITAATYGLSGGTVTGNLGVGTMNVTGSTALNGTAAATAVNISAGTLTLGSNDRLANGATVTVSGTGILNTGAGLTDTVGTFNMSAGSLNGTGTITATTYGLTGGTVTGNLGVGTMNVTGSTALNGTAAATAVNISAGTLTLGSSDRLANGATVTVSGTGILNTGAGLTDTVGTFNMSAGSLNGTGTITATTYGLTGGTVTAGLGAGAITVNAGTVALGSAGRLNSASTVTVQGGQLTLAGAETVASYTQSGGTLGGSGQTLTATTYSLSGGTITANLGTGTMNVTGSVALNGTAAATAVNISAGALTLGSSDRLANGATVTVSGTLALGSNSDTVGAVSLTGGSITGSGTLTGSSYDAQSGSVSAILGGTGIALTKTTSGSVTLTGANTYTGATSINAGTLSINTVGSTATAQSLGQGTTVNLGVASTSSGTLVYTGAAGTLDKAISALGNAQNVIQNSGTGLLTLSGGLAKNGTILTLKGGSSGIKVTGTIAGTSANSDLYIDGGTTTLGAANTYTGPTKVFNAGTLALGIGNAIPSNSALTLGDATTTGTLNMGAYTNAIGSLAFGAGGGAITMAASQTSTAQLAASGTFVLGTGNTINLTGMSNSAGLYKLVSGSSLTGTFGTVTGLDSAYTLAYSGTGLDAQHKANQAFSNPTASFDIITGGTHAVGATLANSAPGGSSALVVALADNSGTGGTVAGLSSSTGSAVAVGSPSTIGGTFTAGTVGLGRTWNIKNTDAGAVSNSSTTSGSVNVYDHASPSVVTGGSLALGTLHAGYTGTVTSSNTDSVSNASGTRVNLKGGAAAIGNISLGSVSGLVQGGSAGSISATLATGQGTGVINQNFTYTLADDSSLEGASASVATRTINVSGQVYSGYMIWAGASGGGWSTDASWNDSADYSVHAAPGMDAGFAGVDAATFGGSAGNVTVNLNGATPNLNALAFQSAGSTTIAKGGGSGNLTFAGTTPGVTASGAHAISAPVTLAASLTANVTNNGDSLEISGAIGESGGAKSLTKTGAGTLSLSGANTYTGGTAVNAGTLSVGNNDGLGTGSVTVNGGILFLQIGVAPTNSIALNGGSLAQAVGAGSTFANAAHTTSNLGGLDTTAQLLDGAASAVATLQSSFAANSGALNDVIRLSDVFSLSGVPILDAGTGKTDTFVLQLQIANVNADSFLGWLDPVTNEWVNAVNGNIGGTAAFAGDHAYNAVTDFVLGYYGVDTTNNKVWAVLDHNSQFATIPEPGTCALITLCGCALFLVARRKKGDSVARTSGTGLK